MKIVIVEDDPALLEMMGRKLLHDFMPKKDNNINQLDFTFCSTFSMGFLFLTHAEPGCLFIIDGDLGGEKTGIDIIKAMTDIQRSRTLFCSFNSELITEANNLGIRVWDKTDIVTGIKMMINFKNQITL